MKGCISNVRKDEWEDVYKWIKGSMRGCIWMNERMNGRMYMNEWDDVLYMNQSKDEYEWIR